MASVVNGIVKKIKVDDTVHAIASTAYGYCQTAANEQYKNVEMTGFSLETGITIHVKFQYNNTAVEPKLKFNGEDNANAKSIVLNSTEAVGTDDETTGWQAGAILSLTYDGTNWIRDQGYNTNSQSFTITANATDGLWDVVGTSGTNSVTYEIKPYTTQQMTASFDNSSSNPDGTTRLNYNGYLYATKLFSNGTEVSVNGHTHSYLSSIDWNSTNKILTQTVNNGTATDVLQFIAGGVVTLSADEGELTISSTDQYVKQTASTANNNYHVLFSAVDTTTISSGTTYEANYDDDIYINPSGHLLNINNLEISSATNNIITASSGQLTIETTGTNQALNIHASSDLYLATTSQNSSIIFQLNSTEIAQFNSSGHLVPKLPTNSTISNYSLGITDQRWNALFVGTADSYGDVYMPVYWNEGVPAEAVNFIQNASFSLTTTNNGAVTIGSATNISDNAEVVDIVVTSGYEHLLSTIAWSVNTTNHQIALSATVDGTVNGYILFRK